LATSGGGYRSLLVGAGVIQGLDERDSSISTSGLFQALTYQSGLSGGSWLLSSLAGNNYPTITTLKEGLWEQAFQDSLLLPDNLLVAEAYASIVDDITAKQLAGFPPTLTDPWGRLLSYQLLEGPDGGVSTTLSSVASLSNFTSYAVPYPVILSLGVKTFNGECLPGPNATVYEFTPYEFGSWDSDVSAFMRTEYLGTSLSNGQPTKAGLCIANYDNLGYVLGTSSNLFNEVCLSVPIASNSTSNLTQDLAEIVVQVHALTTRDEYAVYPNPFHDYNSSTSVPNPVDPIWAQTELRLVDGGEALQNNPIWPFLQPARDVDVLLVNDNSADDSNNWPNGTEILTTYVQSLNHNLTRMPFIPSVETFISEGLNKRATFFGCNETDKLTIVYLPNVNLTYATNTSTFKLQYSVAETEGMIGNGLAMANQGGEAGWGTCLGCAIMMKTGNALPSDCTACFAKYCYYQ
jgi:lysophospholipase